MQYACKACSIYSFHSLFFTDATTDERLPNYFLQSSRMLICMYGRAVSLALRRRDSFDLLVSRNTVGRSLTRPETGRPLILASLKTHDEDHDVGPRPRKQEASNGATILTEHDGNVVNTDSTLRSKNLLTGSHKAPSLTTAPTPL